MAVLTGAGVRIVLAGTGQHVPGSELPELPAVSATVTDLATTLVECCGAGPERVRTLLDPASPLEFGRELTTAAAQAEDVLLVCYVGHGLLDARGELYLATQATGHLRDGLGYTALPYVTVCEELARSRARSVVVLLDCCFSGRASGSPYPAELDGLASTRFPGGYLLTSATREEMALAPRGERYTAFTGELIRLLHDGDPAGPRELTLDYLYQCLDRVLPEQGRPRPHRHATGRIGELALAPNPAYQPPARLTPRPAPEGGDAVCPYRGLASYDVADAQYFFGREVLTEQLVTRLAEQLPGAGILVVVGPSGSGKSSLLRAGLIPALEETGLPHLPGSRAWPRVVLTPGAHPITTLASRLGPLAEEAVSAVSARLAADPTALSTLAQAVAARHARGEQATDHRLILVIDQFEELFTLCEDTDERRAFLDAITSAAASTALVVLGLRADFYAQCAAEPQLLGALEHSQLIVTPMSSAELRAAIEGPAAHAGLTLEPELVTVMLDDLRANEGEHTSGLPFLSHALLATWQQRENNQLTLAGYAATGRIWKAVTRTAEDRFAALTPTEQDTARLVLLRMVHLGEGGAEDTRHRVRWTDLPHTEATTRVLSTFADARLITLGADTAEITHEALLRAWPRLAEWINADRTGLRTHQQLSEAAETWEDTDRDPAALYRGTRLALARTWATEPGHQENLTPLERDFLHASTEAEHREQQATRRRTHRLRQLVAALTALLVFFIIASVFAATSKQTANYQRDLALSREVAVGAIQAASSETTLVRMQLSLAAYRIAPTTEALSALLQATTLHTATRELTDADPINAEAISPDGHTLAVGSGDQAIRLYDITNPRAPTFLSILTDHTGPVHAVTFSPDSRTLASASSDRTVRLWDLTDLHHPTPEVTLTGSPSVVEAVAFSPDGRILATSGDMAMARLWNLTDPHHPTETTLTGLTGTVYAVTVSPDGRTLATSDDNRTVRLWDLIDPHHPTPEAVLTGYTGPVDAVAFSPDGRTLATGSGDATVRLWNLIDPHHPTPEAVLTSHSNSVNAVAFSPDGHTLATGSADTTAQLWNLSDLHHPTLEAVLTGHTGPVDAVAFTPDGRTLATSSGDATVRLWDLSDPHHPTEATITNVTGPVYASSVSPQPISAVAFSPDGHTLAAAGGAGLVQLWNLSDRHHPAPEASLIGHTDYVYGVAFSPDGRTLATGSNDHTARLWDLTNPHYPSTVLTGHTSFVYAVAFSPDGRTLATGSDDKTVRLWDLTDPHYPSTVLTGHTSFVYAVAFSPDGRTLASGGYDNTVRLWDVANRHHPTLAIALTGLRSGVNAVAFSPDGHTLAIGYYDDTVQLWNLTNLHYPTVVSTLTGHNAGVRAVAFSPDGRTLASASIDYTVRLWNLTDVYHPTPKAVLTGHTDDVESVTFSPDGHTLATGSADDTVRLWDTDPDQATKDICSLVHTPITPAQWRQYIPDLPYNPPCSSAHGSSFAGRSHQ